MGVWAGSSLPEILLNFCGLSQSILQIRNPPIILPSLVLADIFRDRSADSLRFYRFYRFLLAPIVWFVYRNQRMPSLIVSRVIGYDTRVLAITCVLP